MALESGMKRLELAGVQRDMTMDTKGSSSKLATAHQQPKPIFPILDLPDDLLHAIISKLEDDQDTLSRLMRVSSHLNSLVAPILYRTVTWGRQGGYSAWPFREFPSSSTSRLSSPKSSQIQSLRLFDIPDHTGCACRRSTITFNPVRVPVLKMYALAQRYVELGYAINWDPEEGHICPALKCLVPEKLVLDCVAAEMRVLPITPMDHTRLHTLVSIFDARSYYQKVRAYTDSQLAFAGNTSSAKRAVFIFRSAKIIRFRDPYHLRPFEPNEWIDLFCRNIARWVSGIDFASDIILVNAEVLRYLDEDAMDHSPSDNWVEVYMQRKIKASLQDIQKSDENGDKDREEHDTARRIKGPAGIGGMKFTFVSKEEYLDTYDWYGELTEEQAGRWRKEK